MTLKQMHKELKAQYKAANTGIGEFDNARINFLTHEITRLEIEASSVTNQNNAEAKADAAFWANIDKLQAGR